MSYQVSIEKCGSYDDHEVRKAIAACLAPLGGLESVVADGNHVLVKLNLLSAKSPDAAVTTRPAIVKATVELVQELGATPVLGTLPAAEAPRRLTKHCWRRRVNTLKRLSR
jgi:uncharacterized protein (DUF362 family)